MISIRIDYDFKAVKSPESEKKRLLNFFYLVSSANRNAKNKLCIKGKCKGHDLAVHIKYILNLHTFDLNIKCIKTFDVQRKKKQEISGHRSMFCLPPAYLLLENVQFFSR